MQNGNLTLNGLRVHYHHAGHGPDVVLIHGWGSSGRMWWHLAPGLAVRHRVWALDLPGFGESDKPADDWYSIPNYTALVHEFVRTMELERAHLVGHSMGGLIAFDVAATHPEVVARVVAINPVVSGRATLRPFMQIKSSRTALGLALRASPVLFQPVLRESGKLVQGITYLHRRFEDFAKGTVDSILASGRATVTYNVAPQLSRITAPTLVIVGNQDVTVTNAEGRLAARSIPNARLVTLPAGHHPTDDIPAQTLQVVQDFLK
jgi:pimeloyl-ACP methyl ester carboxylesterase